MCAVASDSTLPATDQEVRVRLLALAWPAMLENFMHGAMFMINTALAGRLGAEALAGAGIANFTMFFVFGAVFGIGAGTLAMVARAYGANNIDEAIAAGRHGVILAIPLTLLVVVLFMVYARQILQLVGAEPAIVDIGTPYLVVGAAFLPFQTVVVIVGSIMRGHGDTRTPMVAAALMAGLDLLIGILLVFNIAGPRGLGLTGIAIAMSVARIFAAIFILWAVRRSPLRAAVIGRYRVDINMLKRLSRVSGPAALEQMIMIGGIMAVSIIGLQLGTVSFAAQNIIGPIISIAFMPSFGLGIAASAAVGQSLGAGDPRLAHRFGREAAIGGVLLSALVALFVIVFPRPLASVFTNDIAVIDTAETPLRVIGFFIPAIGLATTLPGALRGAGDTRAMLLISLFSLWAVRVPISIVLGLVCGFGLTGLWIGAGVNYIVLSITAIVRFASGRWQHIRL